MKRKGTQGARGESNMEEGRPPYGPGGDEMSEAVCPQRALYRTPDGREARPACG